MKIAFFTNNYLPNPYGVSRSIESFRIRLTTLGHQVFIFAPSWKAERSIRGTIYRYPSIDIQYRFKLPLVIPYSRTISSKIDGLSIDVVHAHHPTSLGAVAKKVAIRKNIPLVFTWHTLYDHYTNFVPFPFRFLVFYWFIPTAISFANSADAVVVPTNYAKRYMLAKGVTNKNIFVIPTGITKSIYKDANQHSMRKRHNIDQESTVILTVCRLTNEKNVLFLASSVLPVLQQAKNTYWVIVGDGHLRDRVESIVKEHGLYDRVIFAGEQNLEEVRDYYATSDVFVYASTSETQGMVVSEAMYMGLAVVAIDAAGVSELIEHEKTGLLVKESRTAFQSTLQRTLSSKQLRLTLSANAKEYAEKNFTDEVCALRMLKVYQEAIRKKEKAAK